MFSMVKALMHGCMVTQLGDGISEEAPSAHEQNSETTDKSFKFNLIRQFRVNRAKISNGSV